MNGRFATLLVLLSLALAACQTPKPFSGENTEKAHAPVLAEARAIEVENVDGPAVPMARLLAQSVANALTDRDIAATANGTGGSYYVLKSKARTNRDASSEVIVHIDWTLMDRESNVIGTHTLPVEGSWWEWVNGDPKIIRRVGLETAQAVEGMLRDPSEEMAAKPAPRALRVRPVTGAPGDGNTSLTKAIEVALKAQGVDVTDDPDQTRAELFGTVEMGEPDKHGQQVVRINWRVARLDGSKVGEAHQENAVPAGSLDGPWGRVAGLAATAAVPGIQQILEKLEKDIIAEAGEKPLSPPQPQPKSAPKALQKAAVPPPQPQPAAKPVVKPVAPPRPKPEAPSPKAPTRNLTAAVADGPYRIQLASVRSPAKAESAWRGWQGQNPEILGSLKLAIEQVDLGPDKGVFYRLQAGPFASKAAAAQACETLKTRGMACLLVRTR